MSRWLDVAVRLTIAVLLAVGVLVAPGRSTTASVALATDCPWPVTIGKLAGMPRGQGLACYGGRLLTFRAYVPPPCDGCGGANASVVSPRWLDSLVGSSVNLSAGPGKAEQSVFVPPALGRCAYFENLKTCPFHWYSLGWVTVSAHFDGPVAQTCRYSEHPPGPGYSKKDAVAECRADLIVLSVAPGSLPATDSVGMADAARGGPSAALPWVATVALVSLMLASRLRVRRRRTQ